MSMRERSRPRNLSRLRPSMIDPDKERGKWAARGYMGAYLPLSAPNARAAVQKGCEAFGVTDGVRSGRV
jgi:hypothetical protein